MLCFVQVNKIVKPHKCSSTAAVITSMTDQAWVAEKAMGYLQTEPNIGARELQKSYKSRTNVLLGIILLTREKKGPRIVYMGPGEKAFSLY